MAMMSWKGNPPVSRRTRLRHRWGCFRSHLVLEDVQGGLLDLGQVAADNERRLGHGPDAHVRALLVLGECVVADLLCVCVRRKLCRGVFMGSRMGEAVPACPSR